MSINIENEEINFEEAENVCDKFNELTFAETCENHGDFTFSHSGDIQGVEESLKRLEILPEGRNINMHTHTQSSPKSTTNESHNSSADNPERFFSVFKLPMHPLILLSTDHRRLFPYRREASLHAGRYDPVTKLVKCIIYDSMVMDSFDKQENLKVQTNSLLFLNDRLPYSGMRDYYYWKHSFDANGLHRCSNVVKYEHVVNFIGPNYTDACDTIIKIGSSLGCLSRTSPSFPRLSLNLPSCGNRISAIEKTSLNREKCFVLTTIEELHKNALNIELLIPLNNSQRSIFYNYLQASYGKILSILLNENSHQIIKKILEYEKGRMAIFRCVILLDKMLQAQVELISLIMYTLHISNYNETQFIEIYFHKALTDVIFRVLRKVELSSLGFILEMMCKSAIPLMHTYVGLSLFAAILSQLALKSDLYERDISIAEKFSSSLKNCLQDINKLAPRLVIECKIRIKSLAEICAKVKSNPIDRTLVQLTSSLLSFID